MNDAGTVDDVSQNPGMQRGSAKFTPVSPEPNEATRLPLHLRAWRKKEKNLSQEKLAERAGCTQGMISQLENNLSDYTGDLLAQVSKALGCHPCDLMVRNPVDSESLWTIWDKLKPDQRKIAVKLLKALAGDGDT